MYPHSHIQTQTVGLPFKLILGSSLLESQVFRFATTVFGVVIVAADDLSKNLTQPLKLTNALTKSDLLFYITITAVSLGTKNISIKVS